MTLQKSITNIVPGVMALGLLGQSAGMAKKSLKGKAKSGDMIKTGVGVLVAIPLIGAVANAAGAL